MPRSWTRSTPLLTAGPAHSSPEWVSARGRCIAHPPEAFEDGGEFGDTLIFASAVEQDVLAASYRTAATDILATTERLNACHHAYVDNSSGPTKEKSAGTPASSSEETWGAEHTTAVDALLPYCCRLRAFSVRGHTTLTSLPPRLGELPAPPSQFARGRGRGGRGKRAVNLPLLEHLDCVGCSSLLTLPGALNRLHNLRSIHLDWCSALCKLPRMMGDLRGLRELRLVGCEVPMRRAPCECPMHSCTHAASPAARCQVPRDLAQAHHCGRAPHFSHFSPSHLSPPTPDVWFLVAREPPHRSRASDFPSVAPRWQTLRALPESLTRLPAFERLVVDFCSSLNRLPAELGEMTSLLHLSAYGCRELCTLPAGLERLVNLTFLGIKGCTLLGYMSSLAPFLGALTRYLLPAIPPRARSQWHSSHLPLYPPDRYDLPASLYVLEARGCVIERPQVRTRLEAPKLTERQALLRLVLGQADDKDTGVADREAELGDDEKTDTEVDTKAGQQWARAQYQEIPWPLDAALLGCDASEYLSCEHHSARSESAHQADGGPTGTPSAAMSDGGPAADDKEPATDRAPTSRGAAGALVPPATYTWVGLGQGRLVLPGGSVYEGKWKDGKQEGAGLYAFADGRTYDGQWVNGQMHGRGKFQYGRGNSYEGEFRHNKAHGGGVRIYADSNSYVGEWRDGKKEGHGRLQYANGDSFEGHWVADKRHGSGDYRYAEGATYEGLWTDDVYLEGSKKRGFGPAMRKPLTGDRPEAQEYRALEQTNDQLRTVLRGVRGGVPLQFRRPPGRKNTEFLRAENARLMACISVQDHIQMVARLNETRKPVQKAFGALEELLDKRPELIEVLTPR